MTSAACEYLWWLGVSVRLRIMTRGEVETINEPEDQSTNRPRRLGVPCAQDGVCLGREGLDRSLRRGLTEVDEPQEGLLQDTSKGQHGGESHYQSDKQGDSTAGEI